MIQSMMGFHILGQLIFISLLLQLTAQRYELVDVDFRPPGTGFGREIINEDAGIPSPPQRQYFSQKGAAGMPRIGHEWADVDIRPPAIGFGPEIISEDTGIPSPPGMPGMRLPCCTKSSRKRIQNINYVFEHRPRYGCDLHAFVVVTTDGNEYCVSPRARWLQRRIESGSIKVQSFY